MLARREVSITEFLSDPDIMDTDISYIYKVITNKQATAYPHVCEIIKQMGDVDVLLRGNTYAMPLLTYVVNTADTAREPIVIALLEAKANVDLRTTSGITALMATSYFDNVTFAKLLINYKANIQSINDNKSSALDYALLAATTRGKSFATLEILIDELTKIPTPIKNIDPLHSELLRHQEDKIASRCLTKINDHKFKLAIAKGTVTASTKSSRNFEVEISPGVFKKFKFFKPDEIQDYIPTEHHTQLTVNSAEASNRTPDLVINSSFKK